eukprot:Sdes_comp17370_c0_seq1m6578
MMGDRFDCLFPDDPTTLNVTVGVVILVGILLSYVPQYIYIIRRKKSDGISPWFLLLGALGSFCSLSNEIILGWRELYCCQEWGAVLCGKNLIKLLQLVAQWVSQGVVFFLFMIYFNNREERGQEWRLSKRLLILLFGFYATHIAIHTFLAVRFGQFSFYLRDYANILGLFSLILVHIQYIPQLITTYRRKSHGSLSMATLAIQCPGAYLWCFFLATGDEHHISTWFPFFTAATFQLALFALCVYLYIKYPEKRASVHLPPVDPAAGKDVEPDPTRTEPIVNSEDATSSTNLLLADENLFTEATRYGSLSAPSSDRVLSSSKSESEESTCSVPKLRFPYADEVEATNSLNRNFSGTPSKSTKKTYR